MRRRLGLGIVLAVAVGLLGLGLVGTVGAQAEAGPQPGPGLQTHRAHAVGQGRRVAPANEAAPREGRGGAMGQTVADLLGMTPDQVRTERQAGKSLATIAAERGADQATLVQTITNAMVGRIQGFVAQMVTREGVGPAAGMGPRAGRGPQAGPGAGSGARAAMLQPVADLLGITPDQIIAERRAGKSLADIAAERGVDQATLLQAISVTAKARLDEQVAAGRLTQERADALYERIVQGAPRMVSQSGMPGFGPGGPGRSGPGRGPGGTGQ